MDQTTTIAPVTHSVTVAATPETAFETFTAGMDRWWPGHRHSVSAGKGETPKELVFEPKLGGAIYEIMPDGTRCDWGVVELWEPGRRFAMSWHPGEGPEVHTRVEVSFRGVEDGCEVTLVHSGWEALGEGASARRDSYDSGWIKVLEDFRGAV